MSYFGGMIRVIQLSNVRKVYYVPKSQTVIIYISKEKVNSRNGGKMIA